MMMQMARAIEQHPWESFCFMLLVAVFLRRLGPK